MAAEVSVNPTSPTTVAGAEDSYQAETAGAPMPLRDATGAGPTTAGPEYDDGQSLAAEPGASPTTLATDGTGGELPIEMPDDSSPTSVPTEGYVDESFDTPQVDSGSSPTGGPELSGEPGR